MSNSTATPDRLSVHLHQDDWKHHLADLTRTGLQEEQAWLPPVWFYDSRGSELFDQITRLQEYYPTRAERAILERHAGEIMFLAAPHVMVELGSGTSDKTRALLAAGLAHGRLRSFIPLDCSQAPLQEAVAQLAAEYPSLEVQGLVADFNRQLHHVNDATAPGSRRMVSFLGSTIGNFTTTERELFLREVATTMRPGDTLLLGTDLVKERSSLREAYDDPAGVTAAFNLNALQVLNDELGADFETDWFEHRAVWDPQLGRIEMHLVSLTRQEVRVEELELTRRFAPGEWIRSEISTKFRPGDVVAELRESGLRIVGQWFDDNRDFALTLAEL